jgi:hypothetical protein
MVKTTTLYQIPEYKILELVVESEPISSSDQYDPCPTSISKSSNPVQLSIEIVCHTQHKGYLRDQNKFVRALLFW